MGRGVLCFVLFSTQKAPYSSAAASSLLLFFVVIKDVSKSGAYIGYFLLNPGQDRTLGNGSLLSWVWALPRIASTVNPFTLRLTWLNP